MIIRRLLRKLKQSLRRKLWSYKNTRGLMPPPNEVGKSEFLNELAGRHGFRHLIAVETRTTGHRFSHINQGLFSSVRRLLYRCVEKKVDGRVDFLTDEDDIRHGLQQLASEQEPDLIFLDSYHTYENSARDIKAAYDVLVPGGVLLIHDCRPPNLKLASPSEPTTGPLSWCGESYSAYLDFVLERDDIDWRTIDFDYGCGLIVKGGKFTFSGAAKKRNAVAEHGASSDLIKNWRSLTVAQYVERFELMDANDEALLRLVQPKDAFVGLKKISIS